MIKIKFTQDYKCCWKKGDTRDVLPHFAEAMIRLGVAKQVDKPPKDKMVRWAGNKGEGVFTG